MTDLGHPRLTKKVTTDPAAFLLPNRHFFDWAGVIAQPTRIEFDVAKTGGATSACQR